VCDGHHTEKEVRRLPTSIQGEEKEKGEKERGESQVIYVAERKKKENTYAQERGSCVSPLRGETGKGGEGGRT